MRKMLLMFAVALSTFVVAGSANAGQAYFGPIGMAMQIARAFPMHRTNGLLPDGCRQRDVSNGGSCGTQLRGQCATWLQMRRVNHGGFPLPPECRDLYAGRGVVGVQPRGYLGGGFEHRRRHGTVTVLVAHPYHRVYYPEHHGPEDLSWFCGTGNCPGR